MGLHEFAMVEELASLVRDNLPCKHLVLSMEEALVNFLQYDTSSDGVLELQPMSSYNRLLLHRLAYIFGFSHASVGEGDERHLVLERCPETSIPSILVSDLLGEEDGLQTPRFLEAPEKQKEDQPGLNLEIPKFDLSLEEREAAYLAARERIFSVGECAREELVKQRPQNDPAVARRMIAHALGQRMKPVTQKVGFTNFNAPGDQTTNVATILNDEEGAFNSGVQADEERNGMHAKPLNSCGRMKGSNLGGKESSYSGTKTPLGKIDRSNHLSPSCTGKNDSKISKNNYRDEHIGAAKRMFVSALGFQPRNGNLSKSSQRR